MRRAGRSRREPGVRAIRCATAGWLALAASTLGAQGLGLELGEASVAISGLQSGSSALLLSVERHPVEFASRLETLVRSAADEDNDGQVEFPLDSPPAEASIWLAIDAATGQFGTASLIEGAPFPFPEPLGLTADPDSGGGVVGADGHSSMHLILVRPAAGAWQLVAVDGGLAEETGVADGRVALYAPQWEPLAGAAETPGELQPDDLLFAVDPTHSPSMRAPSEA